VRDRSARWRSAPDNEIPTRLKNRALREEASTSEEGVRANRPAADIHWDATGIKDLHIIRDNTVIVSSAFIAREYFVEAKGRGVGLVCGTWGPVVREARSPVSEIRRIAREGVPESVLKSADATFSETIAYSRPSSTRSC